MDPTTARLRYHGTGGSLFGLMFVNALLTIITLTVYSAWAKTKVRVYHWSHTELDGDRFAYHGTGGELFAGFIKAGVVLIILSFAFSALNSAIIGENASVGAQIATTVGFYVVFFLLVALAINSARRYRLRRTSWRGIRFSFHGDGTAFLSLMIRGTLLTIVTLGFYAPYFANQARAFFVEHAKFGSEPFMYDGKPGPLFREYVKAVLLTLPTLGLYWAWYAAFKNRHFWNHTAMRGARFQSTITGGALLGLHVTNLLLVLFTLGLGTPWAIARMHSFWCNNLSLVGTVDWATIQQRAGEAQAVGEGLADTLDVDVDFGM